jgi:hypothetical protein
VSAYASTPLNNNASAAVVSGVSNNFSLYSNSSYGIEFQPPQAWDKIEVLDGPVTLIEYTSPPRNETGIIELPAQVVISIEKGLGDVTTLQQYLPPFICNKIPHSSLGLPRFRAVNAFSSLFNLLKKSHIRCPSYTGRILAVYYQQQHQHLHDKL